MSNNTETRINRFVNRLGFVLAVVLVSLVLAPGCATLSGRDPLEGWTFLGGADLIGCPFGETIKDDYQSYIQDISENERRSVTDSAIDFYQGEDGRRAVRISTYGKGIIGQIRWDYILIYDSSNKRIKVMKHKDGQFLS